MKATALLKKQHRKVEGLFATLEKGDDADEAGTVLRTLANDLTAHMAIEQTILYPAVRVIDADIVAESYQEHALAELALKRLLDTTVDDPTFVPKVVALKELVAHHVEEEEEELFPKIEAQIEANQLDALAEQMQAAFDAFVEQGYASLLPEGLSTSADRDQTPASTATVAPKPGKGSRRTTAHHRPPSSHAR
jgi:hemerythrin superfamily protein